MIASSSDTLSESDLDTLGIVGYHGYALLEALDYKGNRLVYLRNPWGRTEWKGKWSSQSDVWTADLKGALKYDYHPGAFWMAFEDFVKYFSSVTTCYIQENWEYNSVASKIFTIM